MTEREFLQQLFLLKFDIEACSNQFASHQRDGWAARLGDLLNRRNATPKESAVVPQEPQ